MEIGYIPRTLDQSEKFFLWEADQFIVAVLMVGLGVSLGMMFSGIAGGVGASYLYGKMKSGKHPKFAAHLMYWWIPAAVFSRTKLTPPSDCRYFLG
ncbi:MAG: type IV conjugative transfer system protein TraL [Gallionella sp.]